MPKYLFSFILFLGISLGGFTQETKVGLVLSGGGADALAHIGVIKALEENNIPISYITGTSMGALIGALYASGVP
ncbi:MAG: NTE family protein, partial [Halieaceae bacterium]